MKILIIEDNRSIARALRRALSGEYVVEVAYRGETGLSKLENGDYAVVVLDLHLPDMHGLEVCREIRARQWSVPVLILTGVDDVESRVTLLRSGADDYLTKPFNSDELAARLAALARRRDTPIIDSELIFQDLVIDTVSREVARSGINISLRRKEYDILLYLIANNGRAVNREMIMRHVWDSSRDRWNNTIDVHVKHLRDKIDRPFAIPLIKTVYGIGYMVDDGL